MFDPLTKLVKSLAAIYRKYDWFGVVEFPLISRHNNREPIIMVFQVYFNVSPLLKISNTKERLSNNYLCVNNNLMF